MKLINSHSYHWKVGSLKTLLNPVHSQSANNEFRWAAYTPPNNFATWPYIFGLLSFLSKKCRFKRSICCSYSFLHFDTWINWPIFIKFDMKNMALETIPTSHHSNFLLFVAITWQTKALWDNSNIIYKPFATSVLVIFS
jgi:hypothetical protein